MLEESKKPLEIDYSDNKVKEGVVDTAQQREEEKSS